MLRDPSTGDLRPQIRAMRDLTEKVTIAPDRLARADIDTVRRGGCVRRGDSRWTRDLFRVRRSEPACGRFRVRMAQRASPEQGARVLVLALSACIAPFAVAGPADLDVLGQRAAFFTSAAIFASSAAVNFVSA